MPNQKPVIFLAFANDKEDNARYLRNLTKELHEIEEAFKPVKQFYEVIHYQGITLKILFDKFQEYKDRIAIFHFGGHADGYQLLLQSDKGGNQIAYGSGLADFFATFKDSLKVVFFNGCDTENLATDLVSAGLPAIIYTNSTINDDVATRLAIRFYKGLANDHTIENAWQQAVGEIKASYNTEAGIRGLFRKGEGEKEGQMAWEMTCKEEIKVLKLSELVSKTNNTMNSDMSKDDILNLIKKGDIPAAFTELDKIGIKDFQYNRFKEEFSAGLEGVKLIDFAKRLAVYVSNLKK